MNHRAKFDAASFILGGEIRNRTNTHTNKQTVNDDISTPAHQHVWITTVTDHSSNVEQKQNKRFPASHTVAHVAMS